MNDTSRIIEKKFVTMIMSLTPTERLRMASRMFDSGRKLAIAGLLSRKLPLHPSQLRALLFLRMYGSDFSSTDTRRIIRSIPHMQLDTDR